MDVLDMFRRLFSRRKPSAKEKAPQPVASSAVEPEITVPPAPEPVLLAITCIGYSHIKHGTVCQDSSLSHQDEKIQLIAVSDGHGSSSFPRSDRGSRLACAAAREALEEFGDVQDREQAAQQLCSDILARWRKAVLSDYESCPFEEAELESVSEKYRDHYRAGRHVVHAYGATLIAIMKTPAGLLAIRCGDGECVAITGEGRFCRPIPWNEKCDANVTTSLCDADALDEFRWAWLDEPVAALWIGTDGVDNSYPCDEDLDEFYANLSIRVLEQGREHVLQELQQFLPMLTKRCSQDDLSVAALVDEAVLTTVKDRVHAYVELRQALRDLEQLRRQVKVNARALGESADPNLRQEESRLEEAVSQQEAKVAQLRLAAGISTEQ